MANEFIVRKGLIVEGASGGTVVDIQGSQGQLFSVTDDLSGSIFAVSDISGVPIFDVNSSGVSYFDGNVGIGTDSPNQLLHTVGGTVKIESDGSNAAGAILELKHANNNTTDVCATINFTNNIGGYAAIEGGTTGANNTGYLVFKTDNAGTQGEAVRILGNGNVGIGETSPKSKLNVTGVSGGPTVPVASSSAGIVRVESSNGGVGLDIGAQAASPYSMWMQVGNTSNSTGDTYPILLNPLGGNVGIGTDSPKTKLAVADDAPNSTLTAGNAVLDVYGTAATGRGDDSSLDILRLHRNNDATPSKASTFAIGLSFYEDPGNNYPRTRADFKTTGRTTDDSDVALTVMSIVDSGNVGIGTAGPTAKLDVKGDGADFFLQSADYKIARIQPRGTGADLDRGLFSLFNGNTESVRIDTAGNSWLNGGNVGIGTTSPREKLDVDGDIVTTWGNDKFVGLQYQQGAAYQNGLLLHGDNRSTGLIAKGGTGSTPYIWFGVSEGGNTERMRIDKDGAIKFNAYGAGFLQTDANGNITAGTVTTSDTLDDVTDNGNSTTNSITVGGVTSTSDNTFKGDTYFENGGDDGAGTRVGDIWYSVSTGGGAAPVGVYESAVITTVKNGTHGRSDLVFKTKNNDTANFGSAVERMRITKAGTVGIGTDSPSQKLHVAGNVRIDDGYTLGWGADTTKIAGNSSADTLSFKTASTDRLYINSSGNVGIGTTNPATLLHLGKATNGANIISFGEASTGGPHGLDFYGDDATRTKKFSIYYRTGTENISMETSNGTKRFEINQSGAVTFNEAFTFPTADGGAGSALITDGSGALSWNAGYKQYSPVGWQVLNNQTKTANAQNISSNSSQVLNGTTPVQRNSATEFQATKQGWYEIQYSFIIKNNYANRALVGAYMGYAHGSGGGVISGSHSTDYVRYNTYGEYAQVQNTYYFYAPDGVTKFYLYSYLLSGSMNMTTQALTQSMISFRYINNDIT